MALIRPVPTDFGGSADYWRIEEIHDDIARQRIEFILRGYVNEDARRGGAQFVYEYPLALFGEDYVSAPGLKFLYDCIKCMPHFASAQDG